MQIRRISRPVPESELENYIHYEHIPIIREASHRLGLFVIIRRTNPESIKFVGYPGFVPKPLACKPKTAKTDAKLLQSGGKRIESHCAGLVVDPRLVGPSAFGGSVKAQNDAIGTWDKYWGSGPPSGFAVQTDEGSGYFGCVMRCTTGTQVFPQSRTASARLEAQQIRTETVSQPGAMGFQLLPDSNIDRHALSTLPPGCSYIHGDYDLYALVHRDHVSVRDPRAGNFDGEGHTYGQNWKMFEALVRPKMNIDMIQHGSQEHFVDHTDEVVDMFCPTPERALWHVKVEGVQALDELYREAFQGRAPKRG